MKKKFSIILFCLLITLSFSGCANSTTNNIPPVSDDENEQTQTDYQFIDSGDEGGICITKYTGKHLDDTFEIPEEIARYDENGKIVKHKVTAIGDGAFASDMGGNKNITTVIIPSSVKEIGENAFSDNTNLKEIVFKDKSQLYNIGRSAFSNISNLTKFTIPSEVQSLGEAIFEGSPITSFDIKTHNFTWTGDLLIKNNVTDLTNKIAIYVNPQSEAVTFPDDVGIVEANLFNGNKKIKTVDLANVKYIGSYAFKDSALQNLTANKVTDADLVDFSGTPWLAAQSGPMIRLNNILLSCSGEDETLTIPEGITRIGKNCFSLNKCRSVILPESIEFIGGNAFSDCEKLEWVLIKSELPPFLGDKDCFGENVIIYTKGICANMYKSDTIFSSLPNMISAKSVNVEFYDESSNYLGSKIEEYYSTFDQYVTPPLKQGAEFICWMDESGNQVENLGIFNYLSDVKLTAYYE